MNGPATTLSIVVAGLTTALAGSVPPVVTVERGTGADRLVARGELDTAVVSLSGEVRLNLTVEGPAPLQVVLPSPPLSPESAAQWKATAVAPPATEMLPAGRERWQQSFRLFPYVVGDAVQVAPAALSVRAGTAAVNTPIEWREHLSVRVTTTVNQPDLSTVRPPADIESLPLPPPTTDGRAGFLWLVGLVLSLALLLGAYLRRRRRRCAPPLDARQRALRELEALAGAAGDARAIQEMADVVRRFIQARTDAAATQLTTPELLALLRRGPRLAPESLTDLQVVLEAGDLAKFAVPGPAVDSTGFAQLHERARRFVEQATVPLSPPADC